ncbi:MAG: ATP-binding protein [Candidatus Tectomicrobia bacterium]|nr:ATP-binding protein [Candidatus Tectomicrobia bacterium]
MGMRSVSLKLVSFYGAAFGVLILLLCVLLYFVVAQALYQTADRSVKAKAHLLVKVISTHWDRHGRWDTDSLEGVIKDIRTTGLERGIMEQGMYVQIMGRSGRVLYRSPNLVDRTMPFDHTSLAQPSFSDVSVLATSLDIASATVHPLRILTLPFRKHSPDALFVQVGYYPEAVEWTLHGVRDTFLLLSPAALLLACLAGWTVTKNRLRPLGSIAEAVRRIGAGDLSQHVEASPGRDEIGRLVEGFNDMTSRLNTTFAGIRRFAEDTSHELRTPLSIMKGEAEVILKRVREPEEYQGVLRSIVEEIDFITKVMEGLWVLSMGESGGIVLEREPIDLAGLLRRVDEEAKLLARGKGLSIILGKTEEVTVTGDERWVRQLLLNLIDNAIKYTPSGGRITLSVEKTQGAACLSIEDTGIGIPEESLPRIFERFYQVDKAKARAVGGCGLGLSICKWIVEAHGGAIEVSSRCGSGTKISVQLLL